jgi:MraZ protein
VGKASSSPLSHARDRLTTEVKPAVFTGEYRHSVDDKGRVAVPAKFRAQIEEGAVVSRWLDACLAIHTRTGWEQLAAKVAGLPITDAGSRLFQRYVFAGAFEADLDRQGRVVIPAFLREWAALEGEAVIVGSRDHAEIWAPARWDEYQRALEDPESLAKALDGLGI